MRIVWSMAIDQCWQLCLGDNFNMSSDSVLFIIIIYAKIFLFFVSECRGIRWLCYVNRTDCWLIQSNECLRFLVDCSGVCSIQSS